MTICGVGYTPTSFKAGGRQKPYNLSQPQANSDVTENAAGPVEWSSVPRGSVATRTISVLVKCGDSGAWQKGNTHLSQVSLHLHLPHPAKKSLLRSVSAPHPCPSCDLACLSYTDAQHTPLPLIPEVPFFALGLTPSGLTIHCDCEEKASPTSRGVSLLYLLLQRRPENCTLCLWRHHAR